MSRWACARARRAANGAWLPATPPQPDSTAAANTNLAGAGGAVHGGSAAQQHQRLDPGGFVDVCTCKPGLDFCICKPSSGACVVALHVWAVQKQGPHPGAPLRVHLYCPAARTRSVSLAACQTVKSSQACPAELSRPLPAAAVPGGLAGRQRLRAAAQPDGGRRHRGDQVCVEIRCLWRTAVADCRWRKKRRADCRLLTWAGGAYHPSCQPRL